MGLNAAGYCDEQGSLYQSVFQFVFLMEDVSDNKEKDGAVENAEARCDTIIS